MARKSTDTVALTLRIREELRRKLEKSAERHNESLNSEITNRLEKSFQQDDLTAEVQLLRAQNQVLVQKTLVFQEMVRDWDAQFAVMNATIGDLTALVQKKILPKYLSVKRRTKISKQTRSHLPKSEVP